MSGPPQDSSDRPRHPQFDYDESPLSLIVSAILFLYVGFGLGMRGVLGNPIYDYSVDGFTWMSRIVGIGLAIVAGMSMAGIPGASRLNLGLSTIAALGCLIAGAIWLWFKDISGILLIAFGLLNAGAAGRMFKWRGGK